MSIEYFSLKSALAEAVHHASVQGRGVAIVSNQHRGFIPQVFDQVSNLCVDESVEGKSRVNGAEQIRFLGGGRIRFFGSPDRVRGYSVDTLVLSSDLTSEQLRNVMPAIATSENHKVIGFLPSSS